MRQNRTKISQMRSIHCQMTLEIHAFVKSTILRPRRRQAHRVQVRGVRVHRMLAQLAQIQRIGQMAMMLAAIQIKGKLGNPNK